MNQKSLTEEAAAFMERARREGVSAMMQFKQPGGNWSVYHGANGWELIQGFEVAADAFLSHTPADGRAPTAIALRECFAQFADRHQTRTSTVNLNAMSTLLVSDARRSETPIVVAVVDRKAKTGHVEWAGSPKREASDRRHVLTAVFNALLAEVPEGERTDFVGDLLHDARHLVPNIQLDKVTPRRAA